MNFSVLFITDTQIKNHLIKIYLKGDDFHFVTLTNHSIMLYVLFNIYELIKPTDSDINFVLLYCRMLPG